eukprot:gene16901-20097_t
MFTPVNDSGGLYGMDSGLPYIGNVNVATIIITYSSAGTKNLHYTNTNCNSITYNTLSNPNKNYAHTVTNCNSITNNTHSNPNKNYAHTNTNCNSITNYTLSNPNKDITYSITNDTNTNTNKDHTNTIAKNTLSNPNKDFTYSITNNPHTITYDTNTNPNKLETAQSHVLPVKELSWNVKNQNATLHLVGNRQSLFLVTLSNTSALVLPVLECWKGTVKLGKVILNPPSMLPPTEANGSKYSTNTWSGIVPAAWIQVGLFVKASADNYLPSVSIDIKVGLDSHLDLWTLPFYLFGCTPSNCGPLSETGAPLQTYANEMIQKWPVSTLSTVNHPAQYVQWPNLILRPGANLPAIKITNRDQERDPFDTMSVLLDILGRIRSANGESETNNQYYAPLQMANAAGVLQDVGGGLGTVGQSTGVGDDTYSGIFIHEQGHAFGLGHSGEDYPDGYPYIAGSLKGSVWGFDFNHNEFLAPFVPTTAEYYPNCKQETVQDSQGRCVKQDVMQGGSGYQAATYRYTMFADYDVGVMQGYFEGLTTLDKQGKHVYNGGKIFYDPLYSTSYKRWDTIDSNWKMFTPVNDSGGLYGMDSGLPFIRNVNVATIIITYSSAGSTSVNQVYPLIQYKGNLMRSIDPTDPSQLALVHLDNGALSEFCCAEGCDYTLRVTYADSSKKHILIQQGNL